MIKILRATIIKVIVALLITIFIIGTVYIVFRREIDETVSMIKKLEVNNIQKVEKITEMVEEKNTLKNYPSYGSEYATIKIESIDVDLPVFFGDSLEILKDGVGHSDGSYFPGEGGSIVYAAHNYEGFFRSFSELEIGDEIEIEATYGTYKYEIYDMKVINETDLHMVPIQREEEKLMVFTCYPFNNIGYTTQRYIVYANPIN